MLLREIELVLPLTVLNLPVTMPLARPHRTLSIQLRLPASQRHQHAMLSNYHQHTLFALFSFLILLISLSSQTTCTSILKTVKLSSCHCACPTVIVRIMPWVFSGVL